MRKIFAIALLCLAVLSPAAFAGDITATGMSQKDLYDLLSALVTAVNELKTDLAATTAKLDADGGVTDNNYTSTNPVSFTTIVLSPRAGY